MNTPHIGAAFAFSRRVVQPGETRHISLPKDFTLTIKRGGGGGGGPIPGPSGTAGGTGGIGDGVDPHEAERRREIAATLSIIPNPKEWMLCYIEGCLRYKLDDADAVAKIATAMSVYADLKKWRMLRG